MRDQTMLNNCTIIGNTVDPERPTIAIVGARMCSEYGRYMSRRLATEIAEAYPDMQFISGMSLGIEGIAAKAALDKERDVFFVLGCGADVVYPPENQVLYDKAKERGGIISRLENGTQPKPEHFSGRNKLIAELADTIIIIEARKKSGTMLFADFAAELGKEVYVLPGRVTDRLSDGTNELLKRGAKMITCVEDLEIDKGV